MRPPRPRAKYRVGSSRAKPGIFLKQESIQMSKLKSLAIGLVMTAVTVAVIFTLVRRFAPENVKNYFRV